jgi:hypothetical protein
MADKPILYPHRRSKDGSYDSIRLASVATVACYEAEAELPEKDKAHVCDSAFLADRGCLS